MTTITLLSLISLSLSCLYYSRDKLFGPAPHSFLVKKGGIQQGRGMRGIIGKLPGKSAKTTREQVISNRNVQILTPFSDTYISGSRLLLKVLRKDVCWLFGGLGFKISLPKTCWQAPLCAVSAGSSGGARQARPRGGGQQTMEWRMKAGETIQTIICSKRKTMGSSYTLLSCQLRFLRHGHHGRTTVWIITTFYY